MKLIPRILVVEDDGPLRKLIAALLRNDYAVLLASGGREAISMAASHMPDLMLLDLGLPDIGGMEVLAEIRQWSEMPVIIISARTDERDKVEALDGGANDYITKPFGNGEFLARIRAALRQYGKLRDALPADGGSYAANGLAIDYVKRRVSVNEVPVHLTPIEYRIIVMLSRNVGKVLTHEHIIREIWGPFGSDSQVLRVNIANIRRKLEANPAEPRHILTETGIGYRMADNE